MLKSFNAILVIGLIVLAVCGRAEGADNTGTAADLTWKDLMPPKIKLKDILKKHNITVRDVNRMKEENPYDKKILDEIRAARNYVPVYHHLDGKRVRVPGFLVPLQTSDMVTEFLLVPYFGACIHVPPPPPNQIIYIKSEIAIMNDMFMPIQVTGILEIETINSELAESGYSMKAYEIVPLSIEREQGIRRHGSQ